MRFLYLSSALILAGLLASCGNPKAPGDAAKKPTAEQQAAALAGASAKTEGEKKEGNLSQELLDKLAATKSDDEAAQIEEEVWDAWLVSGSATVDVLMKRG